MEPTDSMRFIRRAIVVVSLLIGVPIALAVLGTLIPDPLVASPIGSASPSHRILLVSNPIHTDIAVWIDEESLSEFGFLAETGLPVLHPDARWLLIGWGGRSFYLETPTLADIKPGPTFRALTIDSSVMHVDILTDVSLDHPAVMPIDISEENLSGLIAAISGSFRRVDGKVIPIDGYALGTSDKFFEAEGSFNALLGCNVWTARMLRAAGLRTGMWTPLPISLTTSLRLHNDLAGGGGAPN